MKKWIFIIMHLILISFLVSQQTLKESSLVINIEVPVRVFRDGLFLDNLTLNDFEVFEDGVGQKIDAVYLIKKDTIKRREEKKKFQPLTTRTFFLFFEVNEYIPKLGSSIDYFVNEVLLPSDNLIAVSPLKTYRLKDEGLKLKTREEIAEELKSIVRKDSLMGNAEYKSTIRDLEDLTKALTAEMMTEADPRYNSIKQGLDLQTTGMHLAELVTMYRVYLQKLEVLREVDELKIMDFANYLKKREGPKTVFLFYQREYIPQIEPLILNQFISNYQDEEGIDISHFMADIDDFHTRTELINVDRVKRAFSDSSTSIHFLFLTTPREYIPGIHFAERSNDVFSPFLEMAKASGGFADSSANPEYLMNKAVEANDNYYLLYYTPKEYLWDGKFKNIKVRVKGKNYKVIHRLGYFAN